MPNLISFLDEIYYFIEKNKEKIQIKDISIIGVRRKKNKIDSNNGEVNIKEIGVNKKTKEKEYKICFGNIGYIIYSKRDEK